MDRFAAAVTARGAAVVARVDHSKAAASVGLTLQPTEVAIFGNPHAGTPLMQTAQTIGIDLPLRALVWQDDSGVTRLSYNDPECLRRGMAWSPATKRRFARCAIYWLRSLERRRRELWRFDPCRGANPGVLELLRAGHGDYVVNAEALAYMRARALDIHRQVTKRKISGGTRSGAGRDCRDAFLGLYKSCAKLGIPCGTTSAHASPSKAVNKSPTSPKSSAPARPGHHNRRGSCPCYPKTVPFSPTPHSRRDRKARGAADPPGRKEGLPSRAEGIPSRAQGIPSPAQGNPNPAQGNPNLFPSAN